MSQLRRTPAKECFQLMKGHEDGGPVFFGQEEALPTPVGAGALPP